MKKLYEKLERMKDQVTEKISDRECYYDERSEKWQESEQADLYVEKTDKLMDLESEIDTAMEILLDYLET